MPVNFVIYFKKIQQTFMSIYEFTSQIFSTLVVEVITKVDFP